MKLSTDPTQYMTLSLREFLHCEGDEGCWGGEGQLELLQNVWLARVRRVVGPYTQILCVTSSMADSDKEGQ